jgi:hypothetical protein
VDVLWDDNLDTTAKLLVDLLGNEADDFSVRSLGGWRAGGTIASVVEGVLERAFASVGDMVVAAVDGVEVLDVEEVPGQGKTLRVRVPFETPFDLGVDVDSLRIDVGIPRDEPEAQPMAVNATNAAQSMRRAVTHTTLAASTATPAPAPASTDDEPRVASCSFATDAPAEAAPAPEAPPAAHNASQTVAALRDLFGTGKHRPMLEAALARGGYDDPVGAEFRAGEAAAALAEAEAETLAEQRAPAAFAPAARADKPLQAAFKPLQAATSRRIVPATTTVTPRGSTSSSSSSSPLLGGLSTLTALLGLSGDGSQTKRGLSVTKDGVNTTPGGGLLSAQYCPNPYSIRVPRALAMAMAASTPGHPAALGADAAALPADAAVAARGLFDALDTVDIVSTSLSTTPPTPLASVVGEPFSLSDRPGNTLTLAASVADDDATSRFLTNLVFGEDVDVAVGAAASSPQLGDLDTHGTLRMRVAGHNYFTDVIPPESIGITAKLAALNPLTSQCDLDVVASARLNTVPYLHARLLNTSFQLFMHDDQGIPVVLPPADGPVFVSNVVVEQDVNTLRPMDPSAEASVASRHRDGGGRLAGRPRVCSSWMGCLVGSLPSAGSLPVAGSPPSSPMPPEAPSPSASPTAPPAPNSNHWSRLASIQRITLK